MKPKIAVTFDISYLAELAMKEAALLPILKDQELFSKAIFYQNDEEHFDGIEISNEAPKDEQ